MALNALDHVTLRTARLGDWTDFYARALGLGPGKRPPFGFGGAWLYCDRRAALHLVEVKDSPGVPAPRSEHFAFRTEGRAGGRAGNLAEFLARLREFEVDYRTAVVPGFGIRPVHLRDPEEDAELGDPPGA